MTICKVVKKNTHICPSFMWIRATNHDCRVLSKLGSTLLIGMWWSYVHLGWRLCPHTYFGVYFAAWTPKNPFCCPHVHVCEIYVLFLCRESTYVWVHSQRVLVHKMLRLSTIFANFVLGPLKTHSVLFYVHLGWRLDTGQKFFPHVHFSVAWTPKNTPLL